MSTTTVRLEEPLKARVAAAAARLGKTSHAFIVEAIEETVARSEFEDEMHRVADERWKRIARTGETVSWDEGKAWIQAVARGENPPKPRARKSRG